jgi:hypothetical protein
MRVSALSVLGSKEVPMIRKKVTWLSGVIFVLAFSSQAAAESCIMQSCCWETDGVFANGGDYWVEDPGTTYPSSTQCQTSRVAQLGAGQYVQQSFWVPGGETIDVTFRAYLLNDTSNYYDELTVTVTNHNTNQSEVFRLRGSTYDTKCDPNKFTLRNSYDNANVTLKFRAGSLGSGTWQIDNVQFCSHAF